MSIIYVYNNDNLYRLLSQAQSYIPGSNLLHINSISDIATNNSIIIAHSEDIEELERGQVVDSSSIIIVSNNHKDVGKDEYIYIIKPYHLYELVEKIRSISRNMGTEKELLTIGKFILNPAARQLIFEDNIISLTEKETKLILLLASTNEKISREEILKQVWGYDKTADTHTVETHIYRIRQKLGKDIDFIKNSSEGYFLSKSLI